ncbi:ATP-binding cassette domain-containing protein [Desulfofalx alkaliphila]|uniref:ATP-binding cassette domain-containing protein n=1 Tax=Desulfofalx alkaliphila TaxID=105483 RepID=UPI0004E0D673|nr:ABC transporter ATP-binding protein [Desulfofalx alkaliphila]
MQPIVKVSELVQRIGKKTVLRGASFSVLPGECFGVFGTRATGKSTLLHIVAGLDRFKSGQVEVLGQQVNKGDAYKKELGLVTQERSLFQDLRAGENLDYISVLKDAPRDNILHLVKQLELEQYLNLPVNSLEAGVYQRLALACALLNSPKLLIVDELINDIDVYSRRIIIKELSSFLRAGGTCLWGFSSPEYFSQMSRVGWLEQGIITLYSPAEAEQKWREQVQSIYSIRGEDNA